MLRRPAYTRVRDRLRPRALRALACAAFVAASVAATVGGSQAATQSVVVTLDVLSSTNLDASACPKAALSFGTVLPDSSTTASAACSITFGSSNDSSMLAIYQEDSSGDAMFARSNGATADTSFGPGGYQAVDFLTGNDEAKWGELMPNGDYLVGGHGDNAGDRGFALARLSPTGTPVAGWGSLGNGRTLTNFGPTYTEASWDGILDSNGDIVTVGSRYDAGLQFSNSLIARYDGATGLLDTTFGDGNDGSTVIDHAGIDTWRSVAAAPGGRYMAVGCSCDFAFGPNHQLIIGRFLSNGTRDTTFGTNGIVETLWGANGTELQHILPLSSGKFLVTGRRDAGAGVLSFVARINGDGTLDNTYGVSGIRDIPAFDQGLGRMSLATPDGAVFVPGHTTGSGVDVSIVRLTANGGFDTTWNGTDGTGRSAYGASNDYGYWALTLGPDDVLVTGAGASQFQRTAFTNAAPDGLDTGFSTDGMLLTDVPGASEYSVESFFGREGKIVTVGVATGTGTDMGISVLSAGGTIPDYGGAAVFGSANTQAAFGACLESRSGAGVTGGWTLDGGGSCTAVVGDPWNAIADTSSGPTAKVLGSPNVGVTNANATIRFGIKTALATPPLDYSASITIEVIAPNAGAANTAPNVPALVTPLAGATIPNTDAWATATFSDPDAGQTGQIEFQVCNNAACTVPGITSLSPAGVANGANGSQWVCFPASTVSYWRARAIDAGALTSAWSATRSINTGPLNC